MDNRASNPENDVNRRWRPALMAFFMRRTRNRAEAEDLTQEVFLRLLGGGFDPAMPDAYVFRTAQNLLVDRSRKTVIRDRYRETLKHDPDDGLDSIDPHRIAEGREDLTCLIKALNELPERTRSIFLLFKVENMSQEAIGATFGISESAVKQQVAKGLAHVMRKKRDRQ